VVNICLGHKLLVPPTPYLLRTPAASCTGGSNTLTCRLLPGTHACTLLLYYAARLPGRYLGSPLSRASCLYGHYLPCLAIPIPHPWVGTSMHGHRRTNAAAARRRDATTFSPPPRTTRLSPPDVLWVLCYRVPFLRHCCHFSRLVLLPQLVHSYTLYHPFSCCTAFRQHRIPGLDAPTLPPPSRLPGCVHPLVHYLPRLHALSFLGRDHTHMLYLHCDISWFIYTCHCW